MIFVRLTLLTLFFGIHLMLDGARPSPFEYIKHLWSAPHHALEILLLERNVDQVNYHLRNRVTDLTLPKQRRESFLKEILNLAVLCFGTNSRIHS